MDVCHLSAPCETPSSSNTVFGFVLEREACVVVLGIFTAPPAPRQLVFASRDFLQQKGNRCALMSTADYSRNIARKMRPRSSDGLSVKTTLVSVLPHELGGGFFFGGAGANRRVGSFLFSTADRDKIRLVHTRFWSTLPLPFSPQT